MKNLGLIIWLTQLGISVALPLGGFVWLGVWLHTRFQWGVWAGIAGVIICAVDGLRTSLKAMNRMAKEKKEEPPPVSFNDHD